MDQALLNSPAGIAAQNRVRQNSAMRTLAEQDATTPTPLEKANRHSELALKAERSGKRTVARLHWEMAARNGSDLARQQLTDRYPESALANKSTPIRQAGASADPTSKSTVSLDR